MGVKISDVIDYRVN